MFFKTMQLFVRLFYIIIQSVTIKTLLVGEFHLLSAVLYIVNHLELIYYSVQDPLNLPNKEILKTKRH
jgi:hypothetical protein